jgi:enamine deaminase RidA (YjgF/YER057c/UK114 family)
MTIINPPSLAQPRGYNHGIASGNFLFVAGQIGWNEKGEIANGLVAQFDRALANIAAVLHSAGTNAEKIVRLTIFIKDKEDYLNHRKEIGEVYRKNIGKHYPAMSLLVVKDLLEPGALVEIEATAEMK